MRYLEVMVFFSFTKTSFLNDACNFVRYQIRGGLRNCDLWI